ncbi:hypothetical protein [Streptomyces gobitricini]|uniref:Mce-associated membrane protein n=1 Tax=Streptomyces gobitricini TaxID=68211 RepID=A0ABP5YY36_9ACTN
MANTSSRGRGTGSPARRSLSAAARAAAKRADRATPGAGVISGRTLRARETPQSPARAREPDGEPLNGQPLDRKSPDREPPDQELPDRKSPDRKSPDREGPDRREGHDPGAPGREGRDGEGPGGSPDGPGPDAPGRPAGRRRWRPLLLATLAVLLVAGLTAAALLAREYRDGRGAERARAEAAAAARKAAPVVLSYDHRRLERDFAAARAHLTGPFRDEYRRTTTSVVAPTARKYRGVVKATVVEPPGGGDPAVSVVSASRDRVVVLLFVNQVTTSTQVSGPRVDLNRVRMNLTLTSGGWKVSAVDAL